MFIINIQDMDILFNVIQAVLYRACIAIITVIALYNKDVVITF